MPELPDITVYVEKLNELVKDKKLERLRIPSFFLLRSVDVLPNVVQGESVMSVERLGKQIVFEMTGEYFLIFHLMIAGRLHWKEKDAPIPRSNGLAALDFENGSLLLTESGTKKRASLHIAHGRNKKDSFKRGGLEIFETDLDGFRRRLLSENHTLKRALTDPRLFSGIGNSYSDEILHRAKLSPVQLTQKMSEESVERLFHSCREVLQEWTERLRKETENHFPEHVTAFHEGMAVHGRFGKPCPVCGTTVQRIRYSENETNYCPVCQTGGKLLADRALSLLLKKDWPSTVEELEEMRKKPAP